MILILSRTLDFSTSAVTDWIETLGGKYTRINETQFSSFLGDFNYKLTKGVSSFKKGDVEFESVKYSVVWFRRWIYPEAFKGLFNLTDDKIWASNLYGYIYNEVRAFSDVLISQLKDLKWLDHPDHIRSVKKLVLLTKASQAGLLIPNSLVCQMMVDT